MDSAGGISINEMSHFSIRKLRPVLYHPVAGNVQGICKFQVLRHMQETSSGMYISATYKYCITKFHFLAVIVFKKFMLVWWGTYIIIAIFIYLHSQAPALYIIMILGLYRFITD